MITLISVAVEACRSYSPSFYGAIGLMEMTRLLLFTSERSLFASRSSLDLMKLFIYVIYSSFNYRRLAISSLILWPIDSGIFAFYSYRFWRTMLIDDLGSERVGSLFL